MNYELFFFSPYWSTYMIKVATLATLTNLHIYSKSTCFISFQGKFIIFNQNSFFQRFWGWITTKQGNNSKSEEVWTAWTTSWILTFIPKENRQPHSENQIFFFKLLSLPSNLCLSQQFTFHSLSHWVDFIYYILV